MDKDRAEKINMEEYRCACGKLLFKGVMFISFVEIKCKRCAKISSFGELIRDTTPLSFLISIDRDGVIQDLCRGAEAALGYPRRELIGSPIAQVCPLLRDKISAPRTSGEGVDSPYQIHDNAFLLRDGSAVAAESYCIAPAKEQGPAGYYIFSKLKTA